MNIAPNETLEQYNRKLHLMQKMDCEIITKDELKELLLLTQNATSHLVYSNDTKKNQGA